MNLDIWPGPALKGPELAVGRRSAGTADRQTGPWGIRLNRNALIDYSSATIMILTKREGKAASTEPPRSGRIQITSRSFYCLVQARDLDSEIRAGLALDSGRAAGAGEQPLDNSSSWSYFRTVVTSIMAVSEEHQLARTRRDPRR